MDAPAWTGEPGTRLYERRRGREQEPEPQSAYGLPCDRHGCKTALGIGYVTNPVLGQFCSRKCHDVEQDSFEDYMQKQGHTVVQPELPLKKQA